MAQAATGSDVLVTAPQGAVTVDQSKGLLKTSLPPPMSLPQVRPAAIMRDMMTMPPMMNGPPPQHPLCAAAAPVMAPPPLKPQQMTSQPGIIHLPQGALKPEVPPARMAPPVAAPVAGPVAGGVLAVDNNAALPKEKTPMCLVNELARFNKIQHQYTLTDEQGPAHKKTFFVKLKLGDEDYSSSGPSIKKAQHAAADYALQHTKYKHPTPKPRKVFSTVELDYSKMVVTPTVELNTLAMKRGEQTVYKALEAPRSLYPPPNLDFRGIYHQRYHYPRYPRAFCVSLKVGPREFIGEGPSRQAARHNAAAKALRVMKQLPLPSDAEPEVPEVLLQQEQKAVENGDAAKSEISQVHELALKRNLPVTFEVIKESGPPHMRTFVTQCRVGALKADGEGNGKKISKKRAAEKMLAELEKLPPLVQTLTAAKPVKRAPPGTKKKNRNLIKVQKGVVDYGVGINPISRLIQIQQAKREKEPCYTMEDERGLPRHREFVIQVHVGDHVTQGVGPSKKLAKRSAAEAMLQLLGYSRPTPQPVKPAIKTGGENISSEKKVTFMEGVSDPAPTRQLAPGLLLMPESGRGEGRSRDPVLSRCLGYRYNAATEQAVQLQLRTTSIIAQELLDSGVSPTAETLCKDGAPKEVSSAVVRPKSQLLYLAEVLGFTVQFTDIPKGNKSSFFSLLSMSTNPPQMSDGCGATIEDAHDDASLKALRALSDLGIENGEAPGPGGDVNVRRKVETASAAESPQLVNEQ